MQLGKLALLATAGLAIGHPGIHEPTSHNALSKKSFLHNSKRSLNLCADHPERWGVSARAKPRRTATVAKY